MNEEARERKEQPVWLIYTEWLQQEDWEEFAKARIQSMVFSDLAPLLGLMISTGKMHGNGDHFARKMAEKVWEMVKERIEAKKQPEESGEPAFFPFTALLGEGAWEKLLKEAKTEEEVRYQQADGE